MPDKAATSFLTAEAIRDVIEAGSVAALITLIEAPRNVGAKMLVKEAGGNIGSLGDSSLDAALTSQAAAFLESRDDARTFVVADFAPHLSDWRAARVLFERLQPEPHLVICGAGHVGAALAKFGTDIGFRTTLIDDRAEFVSARCFPDGRINLVFAEDWAEALRSATGNGRGVSVAIVTRGHNEDEECMRALIGVEADYIGLIGSKRRTTIVLDRLREAGASEKFLQRVRAPVGLDIGAVTPEEVALSILAEIVAERRGGRGGSLSAWRRPRKG